MTRYPNRIHVSLDPGRNFTGVAETAVKAGTFATAVDAAGRPGAWHYGTADADSGIVGVFEFDADAGQPCSIVKGGQVTVTAGAVIAPGNRIVCDANGKAAPATDNTEPYIGTALNSAAADAAFYLDF